MRLPSDKDGRPFIAAVRETMLSSKSVQRMSRPSTNGEIENDLLISPRVSIMKSAKR
jgi:hypothetical protein